MAPKDELERRRVRRAIESWQNGTAKESSFRTLVESHYRPIYRFFVHRGCSEDEARDLTQETFFGVYRGLASFRQESRFDTWLYRIAANTLAKHLRNRGVRKRRLELEAKSMTELQNDGIEPRDPRGATALAGVLEGERRRRLRSAIEKLPARMRACLAMRIYQELSYREIATAMKLSVETVKAHLYQARQRLRAELGDETARSDP